MRTLAILLLNDDHGISAEAWSELRVLLSAGDDCDDIIEAVKATEGRFYLPADFK